ncbi:Structure-specific endonuclease subunit SLX1 [Trichoderma simmonsii]|uniref:Structure-specific endonuclease subunit SLX1 n=1 Tax=Trichoderma simmonsii TaxID=1491479 RepID=A0A8G0L810_9HYPO|nr:Structure-specific endonuclease subunit SLX1 [Trichoderma simmonsii]
MSGLVKPLPALYVVYVLRSTVRPGSIYIGSTPNPPRRLKQHNGEAKGGAVRTSRDSLRPWEMIVLVSGFPSSTAALKFEWALNNPHLTLHIPKEERITVATQRKRNGMPRRKPHSLKSVIPNVHLLTSVSSFSRWPLNVHFFSQDAHKVWKDWSKTRETPVTAGPKILTDFGPSAGDASTTSWGIHALALDYSPMKDYIEKAHNVTSFERQGQCIHCRKEMQPEQGLYAMCPNDGCEAMGHIDCWSKHALAGDEPGAIIPTSCKCPACSGEIRWGDMMKELSLRTRGTKEVEKLLKKKKRAKKDS